MKTGEHWMSRLNRKCAKHKVAECYMCGIETIKQIQSEAAQDEREACAEIAGCMDYIEPPDSADYQSCQIHVGNVIADTIRKRGDAE